MAQQQRACEKQRQMTRILARRSNVYTGSPLDRMAHFRDNEAWISGRLLDAETLFVPVWRAQVLTDHHDEPGAVFLRGSEADLLREFRGPWAFLGSRGANAVFAVDVSAAEDPSVLLPPERGRFEDLRTLSGRLPAEDAAILAHARGLMHWQLRHKFCGVCGGSCEPRSAGYSQRCAICGAHHFPRTDPAVIMLVHRGDNVLLGNSQRFPNTSMYSTLAGFVEPGESLEEAVCREVMEEVGVSVATIRYHSSQPWPFPASIMLGFYAEALADEITIQQDELRDARWFTPVELKNPVAHGFQLPRSDSIARRLIEDWLERV